MPPMKARHILLGAAAVVLLIIGGAFAYVQSQQPLLQLGVGYGARVACGCRYIGGRTLGDCKKDFEPGMEMIQLSDDPKTKTVTAYVPLVAKRSATYDPVLGCQPNRLP
jgi:hypothetical protein